RQPRPRRAGRARSPACAHGRANAQARLGLSSDKDRSSRSTMMHPGFTSLGPEPGTVQPIGARACVLRGFALPSVGDLLAALAIIEEGSPFRHMVTPGGYPMSVA